MSISRRMMHAQGPEFSALAWGAWRLDKDPDATDPARLADKIEAILDMGLTTIDHADIYGSYTCEALFGAALALRPSLRTRMELVSKGGIALPTANRPDHKVHHYNTSADHLIASCEQSLSNLKTDVLDLYLIHRPDPMMDADETALAFTRLKESGKIRHAGVSNFTPFQFDLLQSRLDFPLVTNQVEHSVLHLDPLHDGTFDQCQQHRVAPMVWSPLGGAGLFTGTSEQHLRVRETLEQIASETGAETPSDVALAFILKHPSKPVPVLGSGKLDRLTAAVRADRLDLTRQQWFRIWVASTGHNVP